MFLVAGLGNPGEEYAATPHNLGFIVVDRLAARHGIRITRKECQALIGQGNIAGKTSDVYESQRRGDQAADGTERGDAGAVVAGVRRAGVAMGFGSRKAERVFGGPQWRDR